MGHGISEEEIVRQTSIGQAFLDLDLETKRQHPCDFKQGNFFGFREGTRIIGSSGVKDNAEACVSTFARRREVQLRSLTFTPSLNLPKITPDLEHELPRYDFILAHREEIETL